MKRGTMIVLALLGVLAACGGPPLAAVPTETPTPAATADTDIADTDVVDVPENAVIYTIVPEESQVSYTVDEVFLREGTRLATAIGITQQIEGQVFYDPENPQNSTVGEITIDISAFKSDSERRDTAIRDRWLESATYPLATFVPTSVEDLPESYTEGETVSFSIVGNLTVRDITSPVTFETTTTIEGDTLTGTSTANVLMTDFGFDPPDIAGVLKAENDVLITFDFVARPGS
ncbi:MAG: YceI family protein [Chloroflexaceae bacterium]|nr:YceI family protein [Chloroflexaceae bacterium]